MPTLPLNDGPEESDVRTEIIGINKDPPPINPTGHDVIDAAGNLIPVSLNHNNKKL